MTEFCTIICGAPCEKFPRELAEGFIIAADRGLDYALSAGITPNLAVGDFDSAKTAPSGIEALSFPPEKDDTDALIAAKTAIERGFREIRFLCALGGRLDHTIANLQTALFLKQNGISAELFGDGEKAFILQNEQKIIPKTEGFLSVFSFGQSAEISLSGVKYPAKNLTLTNVFPLGVSNEITAENAAISVHKGAALVILQKE